MASCEEKEEEYKNSSSTTTTTTTTVVTSSPTTTITSNTTRISSISNVTLPLSNSSVTVTTVASTIIEANRTLFGAPTKVNTTSMSDLQAKALRTAIHAWNIKNLASARYFKLENVSDFSQQLVSGMIYTFRVQLQPTECEKSEKLFELAPNSDELSKALNACKQDESSQPIECTIKVWSKPWEDNFLKLIEPNMPN